MPEDNPVLTRNQLHKVLFDLIGIAVLREPYAPGKAPDMGVNNDPFRHVIGVAQNDVGGFTPHPRELH